MTFSGRKNERYGYLRDSLHEQQVRNALYGCLSLLCDTTKPDKIEGVLSQHSREDDYLLG